MYVAKTLHITFSLDYWYLTDTPLITWLDAKDEAGAPAVHVVPAI